MHWQGYRRRVCCEDHWQVVGPGRRWYRGNDTWWNWCPTAASRTPKYKYVSPLIKHDSSQNMSQLLCHSAIRPTGHQSLSNKLLLFSLSCFWCFHFSWTCRRLRVSNVLLPSVWIVSIYIILLLKSTLPVSSSSVFFSFHFLLLSRKFLGWWKGNWNLPSIASLQGNKSSSWDSKNKYNIMVLYEFHSGLLILNIICASFDRASQGELFDYLTEQVTLSEKKTRYVHCQMKSNSDVM